MSKIGRGSEGWYIRVADGYLWPDGMVHQKAWEDGQSGYFGTEEEAAEALARHLSAVAISFKESMNSRSVMKRLFSIFTFLCLTLTLYAQDTQLYFGPDLHSRSDEKG